MSGYLGQLAEWSRFFVLIGTCLATAGFVGACIATAADMHRLGNRWADTPYYFLTKNARKYCLPAIVLGCVLLILIPLPVRP